MHGKHGKKEEGAQEQGEQEKTGAGHGAVRVAVCQGGGEENQAVDRGVRLETAATSPKDEAFANESCMGRRRREHKSRVSGRKRRRRQGVEDQRQQTWKALSRSGGGSNMSGCVPGQLAPERRPTRFMNEHPVARQGQEASGEVSRTCEREQKDEKRWRRART